MMCDFGTGNNNKLNWVLEDKQELIDIIETIYRGAKKGRGLVVSPKGITLLVSDGRKCVDKSQITRRGIDIRRDLSFKLYVSNRWMVLHNPISRVECPRQIHWYSAPKPFSHKLDLQAGVFVRSVLKTFLKVIDEYGC